MLGSWDLKYNPFTRDTHLKNIFFSEEYLNIVKSIEKEIRKNGRIILVSGDNNSGKTYMKLYLMDNFKSSGFNVIKTVSKPVGSKDSRGFTADILDKFEKLIKSEKRRYVLFVDDAHNLINRLDCREILDRLNSMSINKGVQFRVVLFGRPQYDNPTQMNLEYFKSFIQYFINSMDIDETGKYIKHKLKLLGMESEDVFSKEVIKEIHGISHGLPGEIDDICIQSLMKEDRRRKKTTYEKIISLLAENPESVIEYNQGVFSKDTFTKEPDSTENIKETEVDRLLYNEIILFTQNMFNEKDDMIQAGYADEVKKYVSKIIVNMNSPGSRLLMMVKEETPDNYLIAHSVNVCILAIKLGKGMGLNAEELKRLGISALFHDVGMIGISSTINKVEKLNTREIMDVMKHPNKGREIIKNLKNVFVKDIHIDAIYQHHERIDGSGYPLGLKSEEIDKFARIIGIVDVYEALTHDRKYRNSVIFTEAISTIVRTGDKKFGIDIIRSFIKELSFYPEGSMVRLATGEIAIVVKANKNKPVIKLLYDRKGKRSVDKEIDLNSETDYVIKNAVNEKKLKLARSNIIK